jgi:hypothetical protein
MIFPFFEEHFIYAQHAQIQYNKALNNIEMHYAVLLRPCIHYR